MISADFAPNESFSDALAAFSMLARPWRWRKGKATGKLKAKFKRLFPSYEALFFLTGRASLYRLFQAVNLNPGSEVLIQAFTCEAVPLPLVELKLKPVYVDIETETFSMDFADLEKKVSTRTKAIILQHTFGMTPKFREKILPYAKERGLLIVEDLAHGFNPSLYNKTVAEPQNPILLLSFGRSKSISSVFGGAILSRDKSINTKLKELEKSTSFPSANFIGKALWYKPLAWFIKRTYDIFLGKVIHAIVNGLQIIPREISSVEKRGEFNPVFVKTYPNALAHLLLKQFKQFDLINKKRLTAVNVYKMHFFKRPASSGDCFIIRFPLLFENRDAVLVAARKKNIFLGHWYDQVVAPKELPLEKLKYVPGSCPVAEDACRRILNLPTTITENEAEKVLDVILEMS